ncbi:hypothetical protein BVY03_01605 [bacterium K02(2017)]|nr:hypothetical protein BVY03_01605 [bacterium K02(2017)]
MTYKFYIFIILFFILSSCGGSIVATSSSTTNQAGGTETGTTDAQSLDLSQLGTKIETAGSALVPIISTSTTNASINQDQLALVFGSDTLWEDYISETNSNLVTDVFGSANEAPNVVTKIRVLLDRFKDSLTSLVASDPAFSCTIDATLDEGDMVDVAFYGEVSNGTSANRFYQCISRETSGDNSTLTYIYGKDQDNVIRVIEMNDSTRTNEESVAERGLSVRGLSVIMTTYAEGTSSVSSDSTSDLTSAYLDLQYNQATIYSGVDDSFGSNDDVVFKSRSRITGYVSLNSSGTAQSGAGDFAVTKYDKGVNNDSNSTWTQSTKSLGRGGYGLNDYSLFKINSDASSTEEGDHLFCLQHTTSNFPDNAAESNCTAYESAVPWEGATFTFDISPSIESTFEDKLFFEANDIDLIKNDASNFSIPTYNTITSSSN